MKNLIYLPLVFIIFACDAEPEERIAVDGGATYETELDHFEGTYYMVEASQESGQFEMIENCWCKCVETFQLSEFSGSPGEHFFELNGHHSTMYILTDYSKEDYKINFKGTLEDESSDETFAFELSDQQNNLWTLKTPFGNYTLVKEDKKDEYPTKPCQEEVTEHLKDLDYMNKIFMMFFALKEGGEVFDAYIPKDGIELIVPGPGVAPEEIIVTSSDQVKSAHNLFWTPAYSRLLEYIQMHNNEERAFLEFVETLPDVCTPEKEALFVNTTNIEERPIKGIARLTKMNDELGEVYTYVTVYYTYSDRMYITKIDASECGA